jgi:hypothetical protein
MRISDAPSVVMMLVMIGLILGAGVLALSQFSTSLGAGNAQNAVNNATSGVLNLSQQLPTVGTIIGVSLIIVVVLGAFAFGRSGKQ